VLRPVVGVTLVVALVAGCAPGAGRSSAPAAPAAPAASATGSSATGSSGAAADGGAPGAPTPGPTDARSLSDGDRALRSGTTVVSRGPRTVALRALADAAPEALDDDSVRVPVPPGGRVVLAAPPPLRLDVLLDGTAVVLLDDEPVAGLRPYPRGRLVAVRGGDADAVVLTAREQPTAVWFTARSVLDLDWGEREGGRSLAVTPADWSRRGGLAADALVPAQVVAAEPEAGTATMRDQLACHQHGAPRKARWNIEPWRPRVSALELVAARCNP